MTMFRAFKLSSGLLRQHLCCSESVKFPYTGNNFIRTVPSRTTMFSRFKDPKTLEIPMLNFITDEEASKFLQTLDESFAEKLKLLQLHHKVLAERGCKVPSEITDKQWIRLLQTETKTGFEKRLVMLHRLEYHKKYKRETAEAKKAQLELRKQEVEEERDFMRRILRRLSLKHSNYAPRLLTAMQFGHPLIIDVSYDEHMRCYETRQTSKQLIDAYSLNKIYCNPYHLMFCNTNGGRRIMSDLYNDLGIPDSTDLFATVTEKSYLDLVPREKLVYLTPDSNTVLRRFNPSDVYIIGAFIDTYDVGQKISIKKAHYDGIRHARIAVDRYVTVKNNISFTLDQMMKIMIACKANMSIEEAVKLTFPKRKQGPHVRNSMNRKFAKREVL